MKCRDALESIMGKFGVHLLCTLLISVLKTGNLRCHRNGETEKVRKEVSESMLFEDDVVP